MLNPSHMQDKPNLLIIRSQWQSSRLDLGVHEHLSVLEPNTFKAPESTGGEAVAQSQHD